MSTVSQTTQQLGLLMVDFDQTCNVRDTTELFHKATQNYRNSSPDGKKILDEKWKVVTSKYLQEYRDQIARSLSKFDKVSADFDEPGLHSFLSEIAAFNRKATKDVDDSGLIVGADKIGLQWAGKQVKFYPGCVDGLKLVLPHVRIVSVNWSAEMIHYSLDQIVPTEHIFANTLLDKNGLSNGFVGKDYISSFDKNSVVKQLLKTEKQHQNVNIFVGDSITDLLCMLEVDIGIIIGDSGTLLRVAKLFGINVVPLSNLLHQSNCVFKQQGKIKTIYSAEDWYQIIKLLKNYFV